jgi:molybdopterin-guanine dinucleotide biosynthesis protein B
MDQPGKDSHRHREAGAHEVLVAGAGRWALLRETAGDEPTLPELLARLDPVDLVLVEGFKSHPFPKLEVHRPALGKPPIWPSQPDVAAVATDDPALDCDRPVLRLNAPDEVADWLLGFLAARDALANSSPSPACGRGPGGGHFGHAQLPSPASRERAFHDDGPTPEIQTGPRPWLSSRA